MNYKTLLLFSILSFHYHYVNAQLKSKYLKSNRYDLRDINFIIPENHFKIIGFGAYHGSAKIEEAELLLLESLIKDKNVKYYLPETDFSIAHYFNEYLKFGDEDLLNHLIHHYGKRVDQERAVEIFNKWKGLKRLNNSLDKNLKIEVVGIDPIITYAFTAKHLIGLIENLTVVKGITEFEELFKIETDNYTKSYNLKLKHVLEAFTRKYRNNDFKNNLVITDEESFRHILKNIGYSIENIDREQAIYTNYLSLSDRYDFNTKKQFARFGFFHIEKEKEGNHPSFFTKLIENNFYSKNDVISIIGYLTKSRVLWDTLRNKKGRYLSHNTKKGFGIGDYWKEYFHGIKYLKRNKISDLTIFKLNASNSPYHSSHGDLIEVRSFFGRPAKDVFKNKVTSSFLDYALLICNSNANTPLK